VIIQRDDSFLVCSSAALLEPSDRLEAWAQRHIRVDPDIRWILGNYVEADNANSNGHIFPLDELIQAQATLPGKPLNMMHREHYIVGAFAGAQLLTTEGVPVTAAEVDVATRSEVGAHIEALAGMWHNRFTEEFFNVRRAHAEGSLFFSMEAIPDQVSCPTCDHRTAFAGITSDTYCDHMQGATGPKRLHTPTFSGGAIILPPVKPGWSRADITAIARYLDDPAAEEVYDAVATESPQLSPQEWERLMIEIIGTDLEDRKVKTDERKKLAKSGDAMPDGCLSADTEFITANGVQRIGESVGPVSVLTDVGWADAVIRSYGVKRLVEVVLAGPTGESTIHATEGHRWPLADGRWVETRHLEEGDAIPHVEVGKQAFHTHGVDAAQGDVARVTDDAANLAGSMIMVDHEGRPVAASAVVSTPVLSGTPTATTYATLSDKNVVVLNLGDSVLSAKNAITSAVPALIGDLDALGRCSRPRDDAEPAFGSAPATSLIEVGVRTFDTAKATEDGALVLNGETFGLDVSQASAWHVIRVARTSRKEEVFCAEVPDLHRFVLANGVLTGNSFPIANRGDLFNAIRSIGRAKDPAAVKSHIKKRAKELGLSNVVPKGW
jgi:hypothetical protein